ncbi:MAG: glycosyltransferase [Planctomycetes bacterium]|nr:glycosyltransferase [Planctomycetota bacterium]
MISIIIRTKNEERWITSCLRSVFKQDYKDFEVIIVDNDSTDKTLEKAKEFNVKKIVTCKDYLPGKAINLGVAESVGDYLVCLSGHCIPVNDKWLSGFMENFKDKKVAGVYGRQEPMSFTADFDKRDLSIVFGLDKKIQLKDSFFHNANSMIRRDVWEEIPFDEKVTNIEDRVWAKNVLGKGYKIIYEPQASVYHYHGIHQNGNVERCTNVVKIMGSIEDFSGQHLEIENLNIVAVIPIRGPLQYLKEKPLIGYTIEHALKSKYIKKIIVATDDPQIAEAAVELGAEVPFLRDASLSEEHVDIDQVLEHCLNKIESLGIFPDLLVLLEATFPFRPDSLIDNMIKQMVKKGMDSIIAAKRENKSLWKEKEGQIEQIDEGLTPRKFKEPSFIGLKGVGCVTHPEFIREGTLLGHKIGLYEIDNPYSPIEVRSEEDFKLAEKLIGSWQQQIKQKLNTRSV